MDAHELYMQRCLELAARGQGKTGANPLVGAVLVREGKIIGEGWHERFGGPHAEINAIDSVAPGERDKIPGSDLYVNLEPCDHYGKTPPCTERILSEKIGSVCIGMQDPFPEVNGRGITKLRTGGIQVHVPVLERDCYFLNRMYVNRCHGAPYFTLKWACSDDGFIAGPGGLAVHITNPWSDMLIHKWRATHKGILVGAGTALADDPQLNVRHWTGASPVRIVLENKGSLTTNLQVFRASGETIVISSSDKVIPGQWLHINSLREIPGLLFARGIDSVLVEGGKKTLEGLLADGLWDEIRIFRTKHRIGEGIRAPDITGLGAPGREEAIFNDTLFSYFRR